MLQGWVNKGRISIITSVIRHFVLICHKQISFQELKNAAAVSASSELPLSCTSSSFPTLKKISFLMLFLLQCGPVHTKTLILCNYLRISFIYFLTPQSLLPFWKAQAKSICSKAESSHCSARLCLTIKSLFRPMALGVHPRLAIRPF